MAYNRGKINWGLLRLWRDATAKGVRGATAKPPEIGRETSFDS